MLDEWTLTISLSEKGDQLFFEFSLLTPDRNHQWRENRLIRRGIFEQIINHIALFFDPNAARSRNANLRSFMQLVERSFQFEKFLRSTDFADGDMLAIRTVVTSFPWDLLPYKSGFLGSQLNVGLKIPTVRRTEWSRGLVEGPSRFLHIVANPKSDLHLAADEIQIVSSLVRSHGMEYELLKDPNPEEVIRMFSSGQDFRCVHFTGHVLPERGLLLFGGILSVEEIVQYFWGENQIVVLNGCDAIYDRIATPAKQTVGNPDLFQSASVANAFLDAGALAVIAPRSRVSDREAYDFAGEIWKPLLSGEFLGPTLRKLRERSSQVATTLTAYSYLLYGSPAMKVLKEGRIQVNPGLKQSQLFHEAARDAAGPVTARNIFGVLTRRWIVAHKYFADFGQGYFVALEDLRMELGVPSPPPIPNLEGDVEFSHAGRLVLERASVRASNGETDELALLEALAEVDDPEVRGALESVRRGPRDIHKIVRAARDWRAGGAACHETFVQPDGYLNPVLFLPPRRQLSVLDSAKRISKWDLLAALVIATPRIQSIWGQFVQVLPNDLQWTVDSPLHWTWLAVPAKQAVWDAILMAESERAHELHAGFLLANIVIPESFPWSELTPERQEWLRTKGLGETVWHRFLNRLRVLSTVWV